MIFRRHLILTLFIALVATACSGSVNFSFGGETAAEAAVGLIEGEAMSQRLAVGPITNVVCDDPPNEDDGTVFPCTATAQDATVEFDVLIEPDDKIFAETTNVVLGSSMDQLTNGVVDALNEANNYGLPRGSLDCGADSVVLPADRIMSCFLTDPGTGTVFNANVTIGDTSIGEFDVQILDPVE